MGEFEVQAPQGWSEVPSAQAQQFLQAHPEAELTDLKNSNQMAGIEARLQDDGIIGQADSLADFRIFKDGEEYRIWYLLSPQP